MLKVKIWLLVVYGITAARDGSSYTSPVAVVDDLVSKEQCMALGARIARKTDRATFDCTGLTKVRR